MRRVSCVQKVAETLQDDPPVQPVSAANEASAEATSLPVSPAVRPRMLALLWCLVSPGALFLLLRERAWLQAADVSARFQAVRLEQWVAVGLLLAHGWFLWRWWRTRS